MSLDLEQPGVASSQGLDCSLDIRRRWQPCPCVLAGYYSCSGLKAGPAVSYGAGGTPGPGEARSSGAAVARLVPRQALLAASAPACKPSCVREASLAVGHAYRLCTKGCPNATAEFWPAADTSRQG